MTKLASLGIEAHTLDVLSDFSIAACVCKLSSLDILINNASAKFLMPVSDVSVPDAKKLFNLNVWYYIAMAQAFLPLLLKSKGMIVNQTSIGSVAVLPFQSVYTASKAPMAVISNLMRLELDAFDITVVDSKTGVVRSNLIKNHKEVNQPSLPEGSIYEPAREVVDKAVRQEGFADSGMPVEQLAKLLVQDFLKKNPLPVIWRGESALLARDAAMLPFGLLGGTIKEMTGSDAVEEIIRNREY
jgi:1-acylglycerone phosphate reductase